MKTTNIGLLSLIGLLVLIMPSLALSQTSFEKLKIEVDAFNEAAKLKPGCEQTQFHLPKNNLKDRMNLLETTVQFASMYQGGRCCDINLDKALNLYALAIEFGNEDKIISPATSGIVDMKVKGSIAPKIAEIKDIKEKKKAQVEFASKQAREKEELEKQKKAKYESDQAKVVAYTMQLDLTINDISQKLNKKEINGIVFDRFEQIFDDIDNNILADPTSPYFEADKNLALAYTEKVLALTEVYNSLTPSESATDSPQEVAVDSSAAIAPALRQDVPIAKNVDKLPVIEPKRDVAKEATSPADNKASTSTAVNKIYNKISEFGVAFLVFSTVALIIFGIYLGISDKAVFYYDSSDLFVSLVPFVTLSILYIVAILDESKIYSIALIVVSFAGIVYVSYRTIKSNNFNYKIALPVVFAKIFLSATIVFKFIELIFSSRRQNASQRLSNIIIFSTASFLSTKLINGHRVYARNGWNADN